MVFRKLWNTVLMLPITLSDCGN